MSRRVCLPCIATVMTILVIGVSCEKRQPLEAAPQPRRLEFGMKPTAKITFLSTQLNPVEEAGKMRASILADFPGVVDSRPNDNNWLLSQIEAELKTDPSDSFLCGQSGIHQRFSYNHLISFGSM